MNLERLHVTITATPLKMQSTGVTVSTSIHKSGVVDQPSLELLFANHTHAPTNQMSAEPNSVTEARSAGYWCEVCIVV